MLTDTNEVSTTHIKAYGAYPFSSDETYQVGIHYSFHQGLAIFSNHSHFSPRKQGLASILGAGTLDANSSPEVRDELERRTRVFYFNK